MRRNPIRSATKSQIVLFFSKSRQSRKHNSTLRWTQGLSARTHELQYIARGRFPPFAEILSRCGEIRSDRLPRAKLCCFSAKSDRITSISRRSDGLRRYKLARINFNTLRDGIFLRLPRSCRVAEKSDPIDRFSGPDLQKITKNQWFLSNFSTTRHDRAKRRKTDLANVSKRRLPTF